MDFLSKYKKIFLVGGFIAVVLVLGYLLYSLFFKPAVPPPVVTEPTATPTPSRLPIAKPGEGEIVPPEEKIGLPTEPEVLEKEADVVAHGDLTQITELNKTTSIGTTLSKDGSDLQYYNQKDGKFYRITKDGQITPLSDKTFHQVQSIVWSPNKDKAILEYPDGANIIYDFTTNKQVTLPKHWKDFDFSSNGQQIVMKSMGLDPDNRWLAIVSDDGSKARRIEALGDKDATVYPSWSPNNQSIAMYTKGIGFDRQEIFFVGLHNENFKSAIIEGRGFEPKWSPKGDRLLYSVYSSQTDLKPSLWIVNAQGESIGTGRKSLKIETWANKCTFADNINLYCAVPENLEEGAGLFPEMAKNTSDRLYKIDIRTGLKKLVAIPDDWYNMSDLIISDNGYYLYFTDETTGRLHKIRLK